MYLLKDSTKDRLSIASDRFSPKGFFNQKSKEVHTIIIATIKTLFYTGTIAHSDLFAQVCSLQVQT